MIKRNILLKKTKILIVFIEIYFPLIFTLNTFNGFNSGIIKKYNAVGPSIEEELETLSLSLNRKHGENIIGFIFPNDNIENDAILYNIMDSINEFNYAKSILFKDEKEMDDYINDINHNLVAGIIFESEDYLKYTVRVNGMYVPDPTTEPVSNYAYGRYQIESRGITAKSYLNLFVPIQNIVDQAIIRLKTNDNSFNLIYQVGKLGKPKVEYSSSSIFNKNKISYNISAMFMSSVITIIIFLVKEKENKIKDSLLMAGVHPTIFWLSWLFIYIVFVFITSILATIFYYFTGIFENINPVIIFFLIFFYGLSNCNLAFLFSTFFKSVKSAVSAVSIVMVFFTFCNMGTSFIDITVRKILSFFFSSISIGSFMQEIFNMKLQNNNLSTNTIIKSNASIFFLGLVFTNVLYFTLAIILDNIFSEGISYLFNKNIKLNDYYDTKQKFIQDIQECSNKNCRIEVSHVHKIFKRKNDKNDEEDQNNNLKNDEFFAVDNINFKVNNNEIFAILGHNGAGKTTLINILVGLLKPSYGDVYFDGKKVSSDISSIRKDFGVCAQNNIIYDELTVEDHINFYANLKNITVNVDKVLTEFDLIEQKGLKVSKLSGGQKRKLCISMATIGNPKYIFLDEPTAGLDPLSRRNIWNLLLKKKEGRVIFLTTHYMDEADILADRILILKKGKIRCLGTSLYLKNHFNMCYNLDIETNNVSLVDELLKNYIPEVVYYIKKENEVIDSTAKCYSWKLPINSTSNFEKLLGDLDYLKKPNINIIQKYALTMPTLEELFISLEDGNMDQFNEELPSIQTEIELPKLKPIISKPSHIAYLKCLVKYRLKIFLKSKTFVFNSVITPVITAAITFFIVSKVTNNINTTTKSKIISVPTMYKNTLVNYDSDSPYIIPQEQMITALGNNSTLRSMPLNEIPCPKVNENYYLSSIFGEKIDNSNTFNVYYNETMIHSIPATFNAISNAILSSKNINDQIVIKSHPFKKTNNSKIISGLMIGGIMVGMCLVTPLSKFGPLITHERVDQLLQQLQLNGVSRINYWISCFISDNLIFLSSSFLIIASGLMVKFEPLLDVKSFIVILISLIIWSIPTLFYQYILSFFFSTEETAITYTNIINSFTNIFGFTLFSIIDAMGSSKYENILINGTLYNILPLIYNVVLTTIVPSYGIISILNALFNIRIYSKLFNYEFSIKTILAIRNGISPVIIILLFLIIIYFSVLIKLDKKKNQTNKNDINELDLNSKTHYESILEQGDEDVYNEFRKVKDHQKDLSISVFHLRKEYNVPIPRNKKKALNYINNVDIKNFTYGEVHPSVFSNKLVKTAVVDVSFGVQKNECFGLLGPNGAGKSTTLNIITSTIPQTTGTICFNGVETHLARLGEISMGYCPQKDILWKELTLREHIEFFLNVRGYSIEESKEYAIQYIKIAGLEEYQYKRTEYLSGGTKRKLSLLIAICGNPKQIILDEPTTSMDPSTRRLIWNIIHKTKSINDSAIILTTHSMEEVENLCDRLAILLNGRLVCIGSSKHLKMKYGENYVLELQSNDIDCFHKEIIINENLFKGKPYKMERLSNNRAKYEVKINDSFNYIFKIMEKYKSIGLVQDYSFSQTSLEQVFINFAKKQITNTNY